MKTVWKYSIDTETTRLLHTLKYISNGFYALNGFYPVPPSHKLTNDSFVPIPDIDYKSIRNFRKRVNSIKIDDNNFELQKDPELVLEVRNLLLKYKLPKVNYTEIQDLWNRACPSILKEINHIAPDTKGMIDEIQIMPTTFGTTTSFSVIEKKRDTLYIFIRIDRGLHEIAESVVSSLTRKDVSENFSGLWNESEMLADWIVSRSSLRNVLNRFETSDFSGTTKMTRNSQSNTVKRLSREFCQKIGLDDRLETLKIQDNHITYSGNQIYNLTHTESEILNKLIFKRGGVLSFDELADIIYKDEDDFSLYAMSKRIERLRIKLEANGITGSVIQTVRGYGYSLRLN